MDSGNRADICNSALPFTLETPPYHEGGSDGVNRRRTIPKTLNLFPLTPNSQTFEQDSPVRPTSARHGPRPRSSPFRGVTHYKRTGRWEAHIWNKGKQIYLGASSTAQKAARAYDRAAIHFRGMGAELNFTFEDYATESQQLVEVTDAELEAMLRKQSAGEGTLYPEYPPRIQLPLHTPKLFGVPLYSASQHRTKPGHRGP